MAYDIYVLPEGALTIAGGVLDGVTQGDGSHLVGKVLTLGSNAWQAVPITDNDASFEDNDNGQLLAAPLTLDGVSFAAGARVEAEFALTLSDGVSTWTVVAFNVNNSSPSYATVEALAFIGPPGGFPPVGVPLTVTGAAEGPSFPAASYATPICFAAGTRIATPGGEVPVERLRAGDLVLTREAGPRPVLWPGHSLRVAEGAAAPVEFRPGALGNARPLRVSRQHRIRVDGWRAELLFGSAAVWVPAHAFIDGRRVLSVPGGLVAYHHLLLDGHFTLRAEGIEAESFHPGACAWDALGARARAELAALCPGLGPHFGPVPSLPALRGTEARVLLAAA